MATKIARLIEEHRTEEVLAEADRVLQRAPGCVAALRAKAAAQYDLGEYEPCAASLEEALRDLLGIEPPDVRTGLLEVLAAAWLELGRYDRIEECLEREVSEARPAWAYEGELLLTGAWAAWFQHHGDRVLERTARILESGRDPYLIGRATLCRALVERQEKRERRASNCLELARGHFDRVPPAGGPPTALVALYLAQIEIARCGAEGDLDRIEREVSRLPAGCALARTVAPTVQAFRRFRTGEPAVVVVKDALAAGGKRPWLAVLPGAHVRVPREPAGTHCGGVGIASAASPDPASPAEGAQGAALAQATSEAALPAPAATPNPSPALPTPVDAPAPQVAAEPVAAPGSKEIRAESPEGEAPAAGVPASPAPTEEAAASTPAALDATPALASAAPSTPSEEWSEFFQDVDADSAATGSRSTDSRTPTTSPAPAPPAVPSPADVPAKSPGSPGPHSPAAQAPVEPPTKSAPRPSTPAAPQPPAPARPPAGSPGTARKLAPNRHGILLAMTDDDLARSFEACLEDSGFQVIDRVRSAEEIVDKQALMRSRLVVLDLIVPRGGVSAAVPGGAVKSLLDLHSSARIVVTCSEKTRFLVMAAMRAGAVAQVGHPFDRSLLIATLNKALTAKPGAEPVAGHTLQWTKPIPCAWRTEGTAMLALLRKWNSFMSTSLDPRGVVGDFEEKMTPGAQVQLSVDLPGGSPLQCAGEVAFCQREANRHCFVVRFRFTNLPAAEAARLKEYIANALGRA